MSHRHASPPHLVLVSALTALAGWATLLSWRGLTTDASRVLVPLALAAVVLGAVGATGRWLRVPGVVVVTGQLVFVALFLLVAVTGSPAPTPGNVGAFGDALAAAIGSAQAYVAPVPVGVPSVHPLLLIGGALTLLALDVTAGTLRRPPLTGLVLLAAYSLPVTLAAPGVSWWLFAIAAALFLAVLFVEHDEQLTRWGRGSNASDEEETDPAAFGVRTGAVRGAALVIGATSTALALALPLVIPTLELSLLDGRGPGQREIRVNDPTVDLRRDLRRDQDVPLLYVTTPERRPTYLRLAVLNRYAEGTWSPGDRDIPDSQVALGEMPALDGVALDVPRQRYPVRVRVSETFRSTWLPTTAHVAEIRASDQWRYDRSTMDFISLDDDVTTAGMSYQFTAVELDLDEESMDDAVSGASAVSSIFTEVPPSLPSEIRTLAAAVTGDAGTRFRKARALQQWFRETGGFRYDLGQVESLGSGGADLLAFLDEETGRVGYCEQFAASMAIMARTLGIPARVAVGFLEPRAVGEDSWEFSAWDLHTWPELYFPGSGWVLFEPTPAARAPRVPAYSQGDLGDEPAASPSASRATEELPTRGPTSSAPAESADAGEDAGMSWGPVLGVAAGGLAVLAVLLLPLMVRRARRDRRLAGDVEDIWDELHCVMLDLGHRWLVGRSPRESGAWIGGHFGAPGAAEEGTERPRRGCELAPEAAGALDRLVGHLERARYSRSAPRPDPDELRADLAAVTQALTDGVSRRIRRRATWWPRSVLRPPRQRTAEASATVATRQGATMVDRAG